MKASEMNQEALKLRVQAFELKHKAFSCVD